MIYIIEEITFVKPIFISRFGSPIPSAKALKKIIEPLTCSYTKLYIDILTSSLTLTFNVVPFEECSIWVKSYTTTITSALFIYFSFILDTFMVRKGWKKLSFYRVRRRQGLERKQFFFLASLLDFRRCGKDQHRCQCYFRPEVFGFFFYFFLINVVLEVLLYVCSLFLCLLSFVQCVFFFLYYLLLYFLFLIFNLIVNFIMIAISL